MNGNKHINKLATQIGKKQDNINGWICSEIEVAKKNLQFLLDTKAKEEKEIEELKTQQEALKNHKTGRLAKVSLYEFVNDWVRPEISFKIFSYLADPHKEGINKARTHRRSWRDRCGVDRKGWMDYRYYPNSYSGSRNYQTPYCELPLYKEISSPFFKQNPADERAHYEKMSSWVKQYEEGYYGDNGYDGKTRLTHAKLRNTNPLLLQLWKFHQTIMTEYAQNEKFVITKGYIKKYLSTYKVNGRTALTYGVKCSEARGTDEIWSYIGNTNVWLPPVARRELVGALMKL
jgi:hypothetical protein